MALVWSALEITADPYVRIETRILPETIRYVALNGRRWEVHGTCTRIGNCLVGAVIRGEQIASLAHLDDFKTRFPADFPAQYDTPVTPEFEGCCAFTYTELTPEIPVV